MLNEIKQDAQARMGKSIDALRQTLTTIRTGRASPALLDRVTVNAYGNPSDPRCSRKIHQAHDVRGRCGRIRLHHH